jgi:hypothetical protein
MGLVLVLFVLSPPADARYALTSSTVRRAKR